MNQRARLRRIESAMGSKAREPETVMEMSDDQLARIITGRPDAKAEDLSDAELEAIAGDTPAES